MNKILITILLLTLLLITSCTTTAHRSAPQKFVDQGSYIENYEKCSEMYKQLCESNTKCVGYTVNFVECEEGVCICD